MQIREKSYMKDNKDESNSKPFKITPDTATPISKKYVMDDSIQWNIHGTIQTRSDFELSDDMNALEDIPSSWKPLSKEKFSTLPSWKQERVLTSLAKINIIKYVFPFTELKTADGSPSAIDWSKGIVGAERSNVGLNGVIFIELYDKQAICIKESGSTAVPEVYAYELAKLYHIAAPVTRLVVRGSDEGCAIYKALLAFDISQNGSQSIQGDGDLNILQSFMDDYFIIIEYCEHGEDLRYRNSSNIDDQISDIITKNLPHMGEMLAFDIVINNIDRLPWPGKKQANPGNVFFSNGKLVAIDNCGCLNSQYDMVISNLSEIIDATRSIVANPNVVNPKFDKSIRGFFRDGIPGVFPAFFWPALGLDIGADGVIAFQTGFVSMMSKMINIGVDVFREVGDRLEMFISEQPVVSDSQWADMIYTMYLQICPESDYPDIINDEKLDQYRKSSKPDAKFDSWEVYTYNTDCMPDFDKNTPDIKYISSEEFYFRGKFYYNRTLDITQLVKPPPIYVSKKKNSNGIENINPVASQKIIQIFKEILMC